MWLPEIELTVKYKGCLKTELKHLQTSKDAAQVMREMFSSSTIDWIEEFVMLCLNVKDKVIGYYKVSKGGTTSTWVDVKVIATIALQTCAQKVIVCHNHPSGNLKPSEADKVITKKIEDALKTLDIRLIDHLIISDTDHFSFSDSGYL